MSLYRRLAQIVILLAAVIAFGTAGYVVIEGWSVFDSTYMTLITVASVGYGEVHPMSTAGRAFTMVLIIVGIGTAAYGLSAITALWVEGDLSHLWEKRKMERRISALSEHVIVCGGGQTGRHIARELVNTGTPFVCVEMDPGQEAALQELGILYMMGDATDSHVLRRARVEAARGLIACMPSDKDNLFTLLSARELNPTMRIVSRLVSEESRPKLLKAGADAVVSNKSIGALRLASEMLRPHVVSVLDAMLREPGSIRVQEIPVGPAAAGQSLAALDLQRRAGVVVFALRDAATERHWFNPAPEHRLRLGDVLIACADRDQVATVRRLVSEG